jgi:hypothetical protein
MTKNRIVSFMVGGTERFYPEKKGWFFWNRYSYLNTPFVGPDGDYDKDSALFYLSRSGALAFFERQNQELLEQKELRAKEKSYGIKKENL